MMASSAPSARFALGAEIDARRPRGIWWPHTRVLADQLTHLVHAWPVASGTISRILYSSPDWDDHPRSVLVAGRRMKTGSFPKDDTQQVVLVLHSGERCSVTVIPPSTSRDRATKLLGDVAALGSGPESIPSVDRG
jgi:hypothetical protein